MPWVVYTRQHGLTTALIDAGMSTLLAATTTTRAAAWTPYALHHRDPATGLWALSVIATATTVLVLLSRGRRRLTPTT